MKYKIITSSLVGDKGKASCAVVARSSIEPLFPNLNNQDINTKLKAIHLILESIKLNEMELDYELYEKSLLSILDVIGRNYKTDMCLDHENSLYALKELIVKAINENVYNSENYKGIFKKESQPYEEDSEVDIKRYQEAFLSNLEFITSFKVSEDN